MAPRQIPAESWYSPTLDSPNVSEASLGDEEFIVPEDPVEQERFKHRIIATAKSLKKKQQQLQADQDLLTDKWTEVLAAEKYGLERPTNRHAAPEVAGC